MRFCRAGQRPPLSAFFCIFQIFQDKETIAMESQMVTKEEKAKLEADLKAMIDRRPIISRAIAEAREKGDLKENADYHAARDEYALNESHVKNLEAKLKSVMVVDTDAVPHDMVFLGSTVLLK